MAEVLREKKEEAELPGWKAVDAIPAKLASGDFKLYEVISDSGEICSRTNAGKVEYKVLLRCRIAENVPTKVLQRRRSVPVDVDRGDFITREELFVDAIFEKDGRYCFRDDRGQYCEVRPVVTQREAPVNLAAGVEEAAPPQTQKTRFKLTALMGKGWLWRREGKK